MLHSFSMSINEQEDWAIAGAAAYKNSQKFQLDDTPTWDRMLEFMQSHKEKLGELYVEISDMEHELHKESFNPGTVREFTAESMKGSKVTIVFEENNNE